VKQKAKKISRIRATNHSAFGCGFVCGFLIESVISAFARDAFQSVRPRNPRCQSTRRQRAHSRSNSAAAVIQYRAVMCA
jgi:hypothetical protein